MILSKSIKPVMRATFALALLFFFSSFLVTSFITLWGEGYEWTGWSAGTFVFGLLLSLVVTSIMMAYNKSLSETAHELFRWLGFASFLFFWMSFLVASFQTLWGAGYDWTPAQLWTLVLGLLVTSFMAWGGDEASDNISDLLNSTMLHATKWFFTLCFLFFFASFLLMNLLTLWGGGYGWDTPKFLILVLGMIGAVAGILSIWTQFQSPEPLGGGKS